MTIEDDFGTKHDDETFINDRIRAQLTTRIETVLKFDHLSDTERLLFEAVLFLLNGAE